MNTVITRPALIVFQGGASLVSGLEDAVAAAQTASTLDLLTYAARTGAFSRAFLVTESPTLAEHAERIASGWSDVLPLSIVPGRTSPTAPLHFGEALRTLCRTQGIERAVYVGGGAMPLGTGAELADLARAVSGAGQCVVANNLYSADMFAFWPTSALDGLELPTADNDLPWLLHYKAGLPFAPLPRTLATQYDIDTPTDVAVLWWSATIPPLSTAIGPELERVLQAVPSYLPVLARSIERAYGVMATRRAEVMVAGRVGSQVWRRLEANLPCQTRIVSEERGMRASGREERGEVRSLLGLYADLAGISGLFSALEQTCNAAFIDSRVLFAHRGLKLSAQDRFASDALLPDEIENPWVREFTEAAIASSIPVILGGHSLVSGGVWALSERVRASASSARLAQPTLKKTLL